MIRVTKKKASFQFRKGVTKADDLLAFFKEHPCKGLIYILTKGGSLKVKQLEVRDYDAGNLDVRNFDRIEVHKKGKRKGHISINRPKIYKRNPAGSKMLVFRPDDMVREDIDDVRHERLLRILDRLSDAAWVQASWWTGTSYVDLAHAHYERSRLVWDDPSESWILSGGDLSNERFRAMLLAALNLQGVKPEGAKA